LSVSLTRPVNAAATSYDMQIAKNANFSTVVKNSIGFKAFYQCFFDRHYCTFYDSGNTLVCATNPAISGNVKPLQMISGFNGQPINGVWKLKVLDPYNVDGGAINSWSLNVCSLSQAVLATVDNSLSNFVLFPNPNKGNFTVQFNSTSSNEIGISVHDMRGRLIMNNSYTNTGLFS